MHLITDICVDDHFLALLFSDNKQSVNIKRQQGSPLSVHKSDHSAYNVVRNLLMVFLLLLCCIPVQNET